MRNSRRQNFYLHILVTITFTLLAPGHPDRLWRFHACDNFHHFTFLFAFLSSFADHALRELVFRLGIIAIEFFLTFSFLSFEYYSRRISPSAGTRLRLNYHRQAHFRFPSLPSRYSERSCVGHLRTGCCRPVSATYMHFVCIRRTLPVSCCRVGALSIDFVRDVTLDARLRPHRRLFLNHDGNVGSCCTAS